MSLMDLFPDLPADIIRDFETTAPPPDGALTAGGDRGQVTDEQVEAYLYQIGSLRAPLKPLVEGQQAPSAPEFHRNGRLAPDPSASTVEQPDYGDPGDTPPPPDQPPAQPPAQPQPSVQPPSAPPVGIPDAQPDAPSSIPVTPPSPGSPQPGDIPDAPPSPPVDPSTDNLQALAGILQADPNLRQLIANYYTGRVGGTVAPSSPSPFPPAAPAPYQDPQYLTPPPMGQAPPPAMQQPSPAGTNAPPQFDEYTDPAIRSVWEQNQRLQAQLDNLSRVQQFQAERETQLQMQHFTQVVNGAVSQWAEKYSVPPNVLQDIRQVAARMGAAATYMNGIHPITGLPVNPDPSEATKVALDIAYHATPSAIQIEQQRTLQRAQADAARRQKLSGVGGSSASVPRQPPAPTDAAGRRAAMNQEVAEMMRGEWSGGNPN